MRFGSVRLRSLTAAASATALVGLGLASFPATAAPVPAPAATLKVAARDGNTLVVGADGVAYGAGDNDYGQLASADGNDKKTLTALTGLPAGVKTVDVAMGYRHSLVVGSNGVVYGAGSNNRGQLTGNDSANRATLTPLTGLPTGVKATAVGASYNHSAVIGSNGVVYGTGRNDSGQLTGDDGSDKTTLTPMTGLPAGVKATAVAVGDQHVVVVGSNGVAYGTGQNSYGELTGASSDDKTTLTPLSGLPAGVKATAVAGGFEHTLVLGSNGVAYGTGDNVYGQLTGADGNDKRTLTALSGLPAGAKATAIAAGGDHSVVVGSNGIAYGAGDNGDGQLTGVDPSNKTSLTPMTGLPTGVKATTVAAGSSRRRR